MTNNSNNNCCSDCIKKEQCTGCDWYCKCCPRDEADCPYRRDLKLNK